MVERACVLVAYLAAFVAVAACETGTDPSGDAAPGDAQPAVLSLTASSSSFDLHADDTRDTLLTVTNNTGQTTGIPALQVGGLTLGAMTFMSNTCTSGLAPGGSCTATGRLTATTAGQAAFQVTATASPGGNAVAALSVTVRPACAATCGVTGANNCCSSSVVHGNAPGATLAGASFFRFYDVATDGMYSSTAKPAAVSDFRLDRYEVTVGRFRAFVNAGLGTQANPPASGAGGRTLNGLPNQGGWEASFNASLTPNTSALTTAVKCLSTRTWTDAAGANESLPINCITWFEAMAFCVSDGGYLPTAAEWNYAASGGSEHRAYPWSSPASSIAIDCSYANYRLTETPVTNCVNGANRVGSESPKGDGKWGQSDLSGNVAEWILDWVQGDPTPCADCANLTPGSIPRRMIRGGAFESIPSFVRVADFNFNPPSDRSVDYGVRCARPL